MNTHTNNTLNTEYTCRCCGQPMHNYEQGCKPARINGEIVFTSSYTIVECHNKSCGMWMQTFVWGEYHTHDLAAYLK